MAAITASLDGTARRGSGILRYYGTGTANQADTLSTAVVPKGGSWRLLYTTCTYSAAPTQAGVLVEIDSGLGAAYDSSLFLHTANGQSNYFEPDEDVWLLPGDAIRVSAPAAGGTITAAIAIVLEEQ